MREIKTKIDFFSKDLIKAIGPGVYTGKKNKQGKSLPLRIVSTKCKNLFHLQVIRYRYP